VASCGAYCKIVVRRWMEHKESGFNVYEYAPNYHVY
jgi:hypothetical protein